MSSGLPAGADREESVWRPRSSKSGSIDGNSYKKIIGNPQAETQKNGFPFLFGNDFGSASVLFLPAALYTPSGAPLLF